MRAAFIDKDGTLVEDVPYNVDPRRIRLSPGAGEGARLLSGAGFALVVVSNQSGVARGLFPRSAIAPVRARIEELLGEHGVELAGFYCCPHHPEGSDPDYAIRCECRKPRPGMLRAAAADLGIDLSSSWMFGDILDDVEAGHRAGCRSVLVDAGHETEWRPGRHLRPDLHAPDLAAAARAVLEDEWARTGASVRGGSP